MKIPLTFSLDSQVGNKFLEITEDKKNHILESLMKDYIENYTAGQFKTVKCEKCGAEYSEKLSYCPQCKTLEKIESVQGGNQTRIEEIKKRIELRKNRIAECDNPEWIIMYNRELSEFEDELHKIELENKSENTKEGAVWMDLKEKKVDLMLAYDRALATNNYYLAKTIRQKLIFLDELISEVEWVVNEKVAAMQDKRLGIIEDFCEPEQKQDFAPGTKFSCKIRRTKYGKIAVTMFVPENYLKKVLEHD
jgi:hypothetical protein